MSLGKASVSGCNFVKSIYKVPAGKKAVVSASALNTGPGATVSFGVAPAATTITDLSTNSGPFSQLPPTYLENPQSYVGSMAGDQMGWSVAIDGDYAVVGVRNRDAQGRTDSGVAAVYIRSGTTWTRQAIINNPQPDNSDFFGFSVAISGSTIVVGAPFQDSRVARSNANVSTVSMSVDAGAAYVFERTGTIWTLAATLDNPSTTVNGQEQFAFDVAIDGSNIVVGAPLDDQGAGNTGAVYMYQKTNNVWGFVQKIVNPVPGGSDQFGYSVAISGSTALVGAPFNDSNSTADNGSAYFYTLSGSTWTLSQTFARPTAQEAGRFGFSVSIAGNYAAIGSPNAGVGNGQTYVYFRASTTFALQQTIGSPTGGADDYFGFSVSTTGSVLAVGQPYYTDGAQGRVYVYERSGTTWTLNTTLNNPSPSPHIIDQLAGYSVAVSGTTVIMGIPWDDFDRNDQVFQHNVGSAHAYFKATTTYTLQQTLPFLPWNDSWFGYAVDIYENTAVVSAPRAVKVYNPNDANSREAVADKGEVYIYTWNGTAWVLQQTLLDPSTLFVRGNSSGISGGRFGSSLALWKDMLVVGAPTEFTYFNPDYYDGEGNYIPVSYGPSCGAFYFYRRSNGVWTLTHSVRGSFDYQQLGISVALTDDHIYVGGRNGDANTGAFWIYRTSNVTQIGGYGPPQGNGGQRFAETIHAVGNTLLIGAPYLDVAGVTAAGGAYIYRAPDSTNDEFRYLELIANPAPSTNEYFGTWVAFDGTNIAIGSPNNDGSSVTDSGNVHIYKMTAQGTLKTQTLKATVSRINDRFGTAVSIQDNYLAVLSVNSDTGQVDTGSIHVYRFILGQWELVDIIGFNKRASETQLSSVAIYGNRMVVGDIAADSGGGNNGRAVIYDATNSIAKGIYDVIDTGDLFNAVTLSNRGFYEQSGLVLDAGDTLYVTANSVGLPLTLNVQARGYEE